MGPSSTGHRRLLQRGLSFMNLWFLTIQLATLSKVVVCDSTQKRIAYVFPLIHVYYELRSSTPMAMFLSRMACPFCLTFVEFLGLFGSGVMCVLHFWKGAVLKNIYNSIVAVVVKGSAAFVYMSCCVFASFWKLCGWISGFGFVALLLSWRDMGWNWAHVRVVINFPSARTVSCFWHFAVPNGQRDARRRIAERRPLTLSTCAVCTAPQAELTKRPRAYLGHG